MVLDGPLNGNAFRAYVEQAFAPTLAVGDMVVMDNLPAHRCGGIRAAIEAPVQRGSISRPTRRISIRSRMRSRS